MNFVALTFGLAWWASAAAADNSQAQAPAASFVIPAYAFDRGNAKTWTDTYADLEPMVTWGGQYPVVIEYDIDFPVSAEYAFWVRFAQADLRTAQLYLDGQACGPCCRSVTGSWNTSSAQWEDTCSLQIAAGKHTIRLERDGPFPHVVSLRFESPVVFPPGWKLDRPRARPLSGPWPGIDGLATTAAASLAATRRALSDLAETFGPRYVGGAEYLRRLAALEARLDVLRTPDPAAAVEEIRRLQEELATLQQEALLANPLLDFDRLLLIRRGVRSPALGLPQNWQSNSSLSQTGYDDSIEVLSPVSPSGQLATLYQPDGAKFVGDLDLDFSGEKLLFSMPGDNGRWQVFELRTDGSGLQQLTGEQPDVDSYDACYLPNGKILFCSTAYFNAVACTGDHAAVLYVMDANEGENRTHRKGKSIRQLCFDQEHNWCPAVLNNGRVLYTRWEYTDTPHCHTRLLFHANPDGTEQMEYLGSNSYWPNAFFYARPIPGHPTKVVAVISGHHGVPRMGELVLFDPARGRHEATGAVQRIPGYGQKVQAVLKDQLADDSWPKFLHPYPLSDKYFLVAAKPTPQSLWGIYLADVFDNMVLVKELPGYALFEPIPWRKTPRPPVIPNKVDLARRDGTVYVEDVYAGPGLKGVPHGTVQAFRVFTYHFAYQGMVGNPGTIGVDGPWDIKRVLGTVPVQADGSAKFTVPANTPISLQPLDADGQALQLMRSWMTAMPGETLQCAGCHERQNTAPGNKRTLALDAVPDEITPWHGPERGFAFRREVQPVLDHYCVGCHNGQPPPGTRPLPDFRGGIQATDYHSVLSWENNAAAGKFSESYVQLHPFVRRPGGESDYHVLEPMEFHAGTTELVQLLRKGHHDVQLDAEAWDRLITWIDLNCPYHGTRSEECQDPGVQRARRRELLQLYGGVDSDPEAVVPVAYRPRNPPPEPRPPEPARQVGQRVPYAGWPFDAAEARRRQQVAGPVPQRPIDLGNGIRLDLVLIPPGEFLMGCDSGAEDERPLWPARIDRSFWLGTYEITNEQYACFAPGHDSRVEKKNATQYGVQGYPMNRPEQPVVRVSWSEAMSFCQWLSHRTGEAFTLPTEPQWEWACRAGTATPFWYGDLDTDFARFTNLADAKLVEFASDVWDMNKPLKNPTRYNEFIPKDLRFSDGSLLSVRPGQYAANAWGLFDMHGNVAEWTRTTYRSYPYPSLTDPDDDSDAGPKVVRGGSWRDRPYRATSTFRLAYPPYQRVFNVGFRVACPAVSATASAP
jgi:formylglycine-generating enzyme required for sulfatase activity